MEEGAGLQIPYERPKKLDFARLARQPALRSVSTKLIKSNGFVLSNPQITQMI
jgi:hypothetical protein